VKHQLISSPAFMRAAKKYLKRHPQSKVTLQATLDLLANDTYDTRLKTHKLKGDFSGVWACSVDYDLRILFEFVTRDDKLAILLLTLGSHDEVY